MSNAVAANINAPHITHYFLAELENVCVRFGCFPAEVLNGRQHKSNAPVQARHSLCETLRGHLSRHHTVRMVANKRNSVVELHLHVDGRPEDTNPVGYITLARMLGCDHSTLVAGRRRRRNAALRDRTCPPPPAANEDNPAFDGSDADERPLS